MADPTPPSRAHRRGPRRAALALALAASTPAAAWQILGADWSWQAQPLQTPLYLNLRSFPLALGDRDDLLHAFIDAMETWGVEAPTDFSFRFGGTTTQRSWTTDGVFITQWSTLNPGGATLAITQTWTWGADITECDQRFYAANDFGPIAWSTDPDGAAFNEIDFEQTALHELGHCAGMAHSANNRAVMYAFTTTGLGPADRHLHPDDVAGMQAMYGTTPQAGSGLTLDLLDMVVAGASHTYVVRGALPGEQVHLLASADGIGAGACPPLLAPAGLCLGLLGPVVSLGTATADPTGTATFVATLPAGAAGTHAGFQAGVLRGPNNQASVLSQNVRALILPANTACAPGETPDCRSACVDAAWLGDGTCDDGRASGRGRPDLACEPHGWDQGDCAP